MLERREGAHDGLISISSCVHHGLQLPCNILEHLNALLLSQTVELRRRIDALTLEASIVREDFRPRAVHDRGAPCKSLHDVAAGLWSINTRCNCTCGQVVRKMRCTLQGHSLHLRKLRKCSGECLHVVIQLAREKSSIFRHLTDDASRELPSLIELLLIDFCKACSSVRFGSSWHGASNVAVDIRDSLSDVAILAKGARDVAELLLSSRPCTRNVLERCDQCGDACLRYAGNLCDGPKTSRNANKPRRHTSVNEGELIRNRLSHL